jgi:hypothetical protein
LTHALVHAEQNFAHYAGIEVAAATAAAALVAKLEASPDGCTKPEYSPPSGKAVVQPKPPA